MVRDGNLLVVVILPPKVTGSAKLEVTRRQFKIIIFWYWPTLGRHIASAGSASSPPVAALATPINYKRDLTQDLTQDLIQDSTQDLVQDSTHTG